MNAKDLDGPEITKWDPQLTEKVKNVVGPIIKRWFRSEVRGLDASRPGGALVVSNHSGGVLTPDVVVFASAFYDTFGYDRPVYTLAHDTLYVGPFADWLPRVGVIHATGSTPPRRCAPGGRAGISGRGL